MTRLDRYYVPHLTIRESSLPPGHEWSPKPSGWALIQVASGAGYWMDAQYHEELATGSVLLLSASARGAIRASRLGEMVLRLFPVEPVRLAGILTLNEQRFIETTAAKDEFSIQIF